MNGLLFHLRIQGLFVSRILEFANFYSFHSSLSFPAHSTNLVRPIICTCFCLFIRARRMPLSPILPSRILVQDRQICNCGMSKSQTYMHFVLSWFCEINAIRYIFLFHIPNVSLEIQPIFFLIPSALQTMFIVTPTNIGVSVRMRRFLQTKLVVTRGARFVQGSFSSRLHAM